MSILQVPVILLLIKRYIQVLIDEFINMVLLISGMDQTLLYIKWKAMVEIIICSSYGRDKRVAFKWEKTYIQNLI